jgi:hypothetical protein
MLIRGDKLTQRQREQVLAAFIYRWTTGNKQRTQVYKCELCDIRTPYVNTQSANGHSHPTIPLQTDDQWLAEHAFHFVADGSRLMANRRHAEPVFMAA